MISVDQVLCGKTCQLVLDRPYIMGVLNVTPDSFSDGGRFLTVEHALAQARHLVAEGADLIDIGGESSRPGAAEIGIQEELDRVMPVLEGLVREVAVPLSIDTTKSPVAAAAIAAGAEFINDISGLKFDPAMLEVVAESGAGLFLMHLRGTPATMQKNTRYEDLVSEVKASLRKSLERAVAAGVPSDKLAIDPGIGFGKDAAGNLEILRRLDAFVDLGRPILLGTSRKRFIGEVLDQPDPAARLYGSLATVALGVSKGGRLFRVHDVKPARETAMMAWAIETGN